MPRPDSRTPLLTFRSTSSPTLLANASSIHLKNTRRTEKFILSFLSVLAWALVSSQISSQSKHTHHGVTAARAAARRRTMILVTGATGLNGRELVHRLLARGVAVRALVRNAAKADALRPPYPPGQAGEVEIVEGDMARPETLSRALRGVDRAMLISSSDPMMLDVQSNFIEAAHKAGVKHVVKLSGIMPELDSPFRFARMHGEIERRLEASGMAFTHLRAGEFMPAYFRQVPSIIAKGALFLPMENAKIASLDIVDIADVAAIALTSSRHQGKI